MPRIVHLINDLVPYGPVDQAALLARHDSEMETTIVSIRPPAGWAGHWRRRGIAIRTLNRRWKYDPGAALCWRKLLRDLKPFAIQTNDPQAAEFLMRYGRGSARWGHIFETAPGSDADDQALEQRILDRANALAIRTLEGREPIAEKATPLTSAFDAGAGSVTNKKAADPRSPRIAAFLSLRESDAAKEIVWAADLVRVLHPGVRLTIYGEGPGRRPAERFAELAAEQEVVRFEDCPERIESALREADLVWAPEAEHREATEVVASQAAGRPVVIGRRSGTPSETFESGSLAEVRMNDRAAWVKQTERLLSEPACLADQAWLEAHAAENVARLRRDWLLSA